MVKPLKVYATGHTSVKVLKALSVSSQFINHVRQSYGEGFSASSSRAHKTPDAMADQLKVARFVLKEGFFDLVNEKPTVYDSKGSTDSNVPGRLLDIDVKGRALLKKKFPGRCTQVSVNGGKGLGRSKH